MELDVAPSSDHSLDGTGLGFRGSASVWATNRGLLGFAFRDMGLQASELLIPR